MISVALTTYNGGKYLREQLISIYAQTYKNIEVVACDDGSVDGTVMILKEFEKTHGLRLYINNKNMGYVKNFEKVCSLCNGEYIALSDQDDIWLSDKLEVLFRSIGNYSMVYSDMSVIDRDGRLIELSYKKSRNKKWHSCTDFREFIFKNEVAGCSALFHRDILKLALPFPRRQLFHDWWLVLVALKMKGVKYVDRPLLKYRIHECNQYGIRNNTILSYFMKKDDVLISRRLEELSLMIRDLIESPIFNDDDKKFLKKAEKYYDNIRNKTGLLQTTIFNLVHWRFFTQRTLLSYLVDKIVDLSGLKRIIRSIMTISRRGQ